MDSPFVSAIVPWPLDWAPVGFAACNGQQLAVNQYMALYSLVGLTYGGTANVNFNVPDLRGRSMIGMGLQVNPPGTNYQLGQWGGIETNTLVTNNLPPLPPHTHGATFTPTGGGGGSGTPTAAGTITVPVTGSATTSGSMSGSLMVNPTPGAVNAPTTSNNVISGTSGGSAGANLYGGNAAGATLAIAPAVTTTGTLTGSILGTATGTVSLTVTGSTGGITGGTVGVQGASAYVGSPQAFENRQPFLVLNFIIAVNGLYPPRP